MGLFAIESPKYAHRRFVARRSSVSEFRAPGRMATCRFCGGALKDTVVDLGMSPLCESYVPAERINSMEPFYPLHVLVCRACWLVQLEQYVSADHIFSEYAYFSSYSKSWVEHARRYTLEMTRRFGLGPTSSVMELASNDGYLLQWFVQAGIPVLGIEPAANVAIAAEERGVRTLVRFFGVELGAQLAAEGRRADLLVGNNVLAQVPDINDFVGGMPLVLAPEGVVTLEFPHVLRLIDENQFDTIYHEHFSYFSLHTVASILDRHGLEVFDVEELPTHGGSLRVYAHHQGDLTNPVSPSVKELLVTEEAFGLTDVDRYRRFAFQVHETKRGILDLLIQLKRHGVTIAGYGAPGKGNTLLNYCGIRSDFIDFTVDRNPYKQGKFLPGTHIPIHDPEEIVRRKPDYVFILPWNVRDEIEAQLSYIREWGGQFIVPIPSARVLP
jgi:C-methyltransferase C-terminal domain/Putative zinc binding domain/Methyltransferase domain